MRIARKAVFDCNVFLQALARPDGPAGRCLARVLDGSCELYVSPIVLMEIGDVIARPRIIEKMHLDVLRTSVVLQSIADIAVIIAHVPQIWNFERDPDDAHYVNLALSAGARVVVSRDNDLLDLMDTKSVEGAALRSIDPSFQILTPPQFLELSENDKP